MELNTSMIGKIVEFDPVTQLADIQLVVNDILSTANQNVLALEPHILIDVPIHFPQCSGFVITMPIKTGDSCLVFFTHSGVDHWLYEDRDEYKVVDGLPEPAARRKFTLDDAFAVVGFNNTANMVTNFSPDDLVIRNKANDQTIVLGADGSISLTATTNIALSTSGDISVTAGGTLTLSGATVHINE